MSQITTAKKQFIGIFIVIAILALLFGIWSQRNVNQSKVAEHKPVALTNGTILPQPRILAPFNLLGANNQSFTKNALQGKWSFIFFGFSNCPHICPTTMSTLNLAYQQMQKMHLTSLPQVVLISVDPERDTPAIISKYAAGFNKTFVGVTGKKSQIDKLTQEMSVVYMKVQNKESKDGETYNIDHSGSIAVIDPKGDIFAFLTTPHVPAAIAKDLQTIEMTYQQRN